VGRNFEPAPFVRYLAKYKKETRSDEEISRRKYVLTDALSNSNWFASYSGALTTLSAQTGNMLLLAELFSYSHLRITPARVYSFDRAIQGLSNHLLNSNNGSVLETQLAKGIARGAPDSEDLPNVQLICAICDRDLICASCDRKSISIAALRCRSDGNNESN